MNPKILFDESHNETWTTHETKAVSTSLQNPAYYSYAHIATLARERLHAIVDRNVKAPIESATLDGVTLLVIAHPADPTVHKGCGGTPIFTEGEIAAVESAIHGGAGLLVISEHHADQWKSNIDALLVKLGIRFENDVVQAFVPTPVGVERIAQFVTTALENHPVCNGVEKISYYAGCSVSALDQSARVIARGPSGEGLAVVAQIGNGRVCAIGDSDIFAMPYLLEFDNYTFLLNILQWLTGCDTVVPHRAPAAGIGVNLAPMVFLSYSRKDEAIVRALFEALQSAGCRPWFDQTSILPGELFEEAIFDAIARCDFFIPCLSRNSVDRRGILQKEIRAALSVAEGMLERDIYVIPVRLDDCGPPRSLLKYQWVNLFEPDGVTRILAAIREGLSRRAAAADGDP